MRKDRKYRKYVDGSVLLSGLKGMHSNIEEFSQDASGVVRFTNISYKGMHHYDRNLALFGSKLRKMGYAIISAKSEVKSDEIRRDPALFIYIEAVPASWVKPVEEREKA